MSIRPWKLYACNLVEKVILSITVISFCFETEWVEIVIWNKIRLLRNLSGSDACLSCACSAMTEKSYIRWESLAANQERILYLPIGTSGTTLQMLSALGLYCVNGNLDVERALADVACIYDQGQYRFHIWTRTLYLLSLNHLSPNVNIYRGYSLDPGFTRKRR